MNQDRNLRAGVLGDEEIEWVNSIHRLHDLGLREAAVAYFKVVAMALECLPHEVVRDIAHRVTAQTHELEEAVNVLKTRLEVQRLKDDLERRRLRRRGGGGKVA